jgi:hypothetical protein
MSGIAGRCIVPTAIVTSSSTSNNASSSTDRKRGWRFLPVPEGRGLRAAFSMIAVRR